MGGETSASEQKGVMQWTGTLLRNNKNEKSEDYSKADLKQRVLFFITIFRLAIPAFCSNHNIIWMENVAIKRRGGNDVQHKNWKGKILRIWITIIHHGGLGHEVLLLRNVACFRLRSGLVMWFVH